MRDNTSTPAHDDGAGERHEPHESGMRAVETGLPRGYLLEGDMICFRGNQEDLSPVCGPLRLVLRARSVSGDDWTCLFRFMAMDGAWRDCQVAQADLSLSLGAVLARLEDQGFAVRDKRRTSELMRALHSNDLRWSTRETGWTGSDFTQYVTPAGVALGKPGAAGLSVFTGSPPSGCGTRETLDTWRETVPGRNPSAAALIGACAAIAPITLARLANPSFILHLHGNDGAGRIARDVASSVWGTPGSLQLSWKDPVRRISAAIAQARDGLVILSGYDNAQAHKLAGIAEAMAAHDATASRVVVLSTGRSAIIGGAKPLPSQSVGVVIVDLDAAGWDAADDGAISRAAGQAYGRFGPSVVEAFIDWRGKQSPFLSIRCDELLDTLVERRELADEAMRDAAHALGALFGAARMAASCKLWDPGDLKSAFTALLQDWAAQADGRLSAQDRAMIALVADGIAELLESADLSPINGGESSVAGWFDDHWFYLTKEGFRQIADSSEGARTVILRIVVEKALQTLHAEALLHPGNEARSLQFRVRTPDGARARVYRITRDIMRYARPIPPARDASSAEDDRAAAGDAVVAP